MKKTLILVLALFVAAPSVALAFTLSWSVPTYTDGSTIGTEANGIFYNVKMDGAATASRISATSWILPAVAKKSAHTFEVQTQLGTGEVSVWSPPFAWTSPAGIPAAPGGMSVR